MVVIVVMYVNRTEAKGPLFPKTPVSSLGSPCMWQKHYRSPATTGTRYLSQTSVACPGDVALDTDRNDYRALSLPDAGPFFSSDQLQVFSKISLAPIVHLLPFSLQFLLVRGLSFHSAPRPLNIKVSLNHLVKYQCHSHSWPPAPVSIWDCHLIITCDHWTHLCTLLIGGSA